MLAVQVAKKINFATPALVCSKLVPALFSTKSKMIADTTAIYMNDTEKQIKDKINRQAFSGGKVLIIINCVS